jgi:phosphoglycolate phosphatase-like HAD superfamily hydrolase
MARIRAVLFDIDGALLDDNHAHAHAWLDVLHGHGKDVPFDRVRASIGKGGDKLLLEVAGIDPDSVEGKLIVERRIAVFKAHYLPDLGPQPGARQLVERLRARGYARAIVTSSSALEVADRLREAAVADLFDTTIEGGVEVALQQLGLGPREVLLIADSPHDIEAAACVGVSTIALRCGGYAERELEGALVIYDHPAALLAKLDESPIVLGVDDAAPPRMTSVTRLRARERPAPISSESHR